MSKTPGKKKDGYTVGITIYINADGKLSLFENGLRQNVLFLYQMFLAAPDCKQVYLLNHGESDPTEGAPHLGVEQSAIVRTPTVIDELDYVISIGAMMDAQTAETLRKRGCKIAYYKAGNAAVISMEASVANPPRNDAERYFDKDFYDVIWMTPQHIHTYKGWCETVYRIPVVEVPQVWAPTTIEALPPERRKKFDYARPDNQWRIGIMDPNITVMKTSHMPMLVCEVAFRRDRSPFKAVFVTNAIQYKDNPHFSTFTNCLDAAKAGVMTIEGRFLGIDFMADHADAVVTHQWENGLNYLYYETLYGGRPLIHNSPFLKDYGYYYEDFNAYAGADALQRAFAEHDDNLEDYRRRNQVLFDQLNPTSEANIALHEGLLKSLR